MGLGGDGDEIDAIEDVERAFGVGLDASDAAEWTTAGDVFEALRRALPEEERHAPRLWDDFAAALCDRAGADPKRVERASPLLSPGLWSSIEGASGSVRTALVLASILALAVAALAFP